MAARRRPAKARTAKKRTTRKKTTRRKSARRAGVAQADLPRTLREVRRRLRTHLNQLEREVQRARALYRRRATRLLREASHRLGRLETLGDRGWRDLNTRARREVAALLRRLERAVAPPPARRAPPRKKA